MLPLLASGHGAEFLDARVDALPGGVIELRITADFGGNPMIADETEARTALADAMRLESATGEESWRLDALAPLTLVRSDAPDPVSPMPRGPIDPAQPHQLLTAQWRWTSQQAAARFVVPETSSQTVLLWQHEPGKQEAPRWVMLLPGERSPALALNHEASAGAPDAQRLPVWWLAGGGLVAGLAGAVWISRVNSRRRNDRPGCRPGG